MIRYSILSIALIVPWCLAEVSEKMDAFNPCANAAVSTADSEKCLTRKHMNEYIAPADGEETSYRTVDEPDTFTEPAT